MPIFDPFADVNGDEVVDIIDALLVVQYYVKLIDTLDGCEPDITSPPTIEPTPDGEEKTYELQAETEATFSLTIGSNKIRLTATASAGAANINITN